MGKSHPEEKSRRQRIRDILEQRRPMADAVRRLIAHAGHLRALLDDLKAVQGRLLGIVPPGERGPIAAIDPAAFQRCLDEQVLALEKLEARFSRARLNIGVVGRARQGKSRLLQSLSGLTSAEIPSGNRQHCTGVKSIVVHHEGDEPYAQVWFYPKRKFLDEVLAPYFRKLRLGPVPPGFEEFARDPLPPSESSSATDGAMYKHLALYYHHAGEYESLLSAESPRRVPREEIRSYVAQDDAGGNRVKPWYLAVERACIYSRFPAKDVHDVALIDMPGLGDTGLGSEERLIEALGQEVDFILFVRKPQATGDSWMDTDVALYDVAYQALKELLPLECWSFMLLNRVRGQDDNAAQCGDLAATIKQHHIYVQKCLTLDCSDPGDVAKILLDPLLDFLAANLGQLDRRFAEGCSARLVDLGKEIQSLLNAADAAIRAAGAHDANEHALFIKKFRGFWTALTTNLESFVRELRQRRGKPDDGLQAAVCKGLNQCRADLRVPEEPDVQRTADEEGGLPSAYVRYLNWFRSDIARHFLGLDQALDEWSRRLRTEVAETLRRTPLAPLAARGGDASLAALHDSCTSEMPQLSRGFATIAEFRLSYRLLIQHRIRKYLDLLDPDDQRTPALSSPPSAEEIRFHLGNQFERVLYEIEPALREFFVEPSEAAFTAVEEFVDRVLRSEGAREEWEIFAFQHRAEMWREAFDELGERTAARLAWDKVRRDLAAATDAKHFDLADTTQIAEVKQNA